LVTRARGASQLLGRRLDPPVGKLSQPVGIAVAGEQGFNHRATAQPHRRHHLRNWPTSY
jgi:hypothetical protein